MLDASASNYAQNYATQAYHSADLQAMVVSQHLAVVRICEEVSRGLSRLGW